LDTDFCAMCGHDWCSVRISKEIAEFASGKDDDSRPGRAKVSAALTPEQQAILARRGVLNPAEIHRLAAKTRKAVGAVADKAACHSDRADTDEARCHQRTALPLAFTAAGGTGGDQ
jgi:phosphomethylpyrimidine synthase